MEQHWTAIESQLGDDHPAAAFIKSCGDYAGSIFEACDRMARIVASMQTFSRRESDQPKPFELSDCIEKSLQLCAHTVKYGIEVKRDIPEDLPPIMGQVQQIEQVLINLINNAAHAIKDISKEGVITLTARHETNTITLTVEDSGPGIPANKLDTIWEAFYSTKGDKGTGLGLSISRGIVEEHHGHIRAENRDGGGARFTITLPTAAAQ